MSADNGISANPTWPKLAGQNPKYLSSQLYEFRKGPEGNETMQLCMVLR